MDKLARVILEETTWVTAKGTCLRKRRKFSIQKKKESIIDPPEIQIEVFAGTKLSSAAAVAEIRVV